MTIRNGRQLRVGRVMLDLTIRDMAEIANLNRNSILRAEKLSRISKWSWGANEIARALEARGISFVDMDGKIGVLFETNQ